MLESDTVIGDEWHLSLLRIPSTGREATVEASVKRLKKGLLGAELEEVGGTPHGLGVGGAMAYANAEGGEDLVAAFMGPWTSNAKHDCILAARHTLEVLTVKLTRSNLERVSFTVGRKGNLKLAKRPGPVNAYAAGCK